MEVHELVPPRVFLWILSARVVWKLDKTKKEEEEGALLLVVEAGVEMVNG